MFRRRSTPPPYEVMGGPPRAGGPSRPAPPAAAPTRPASSPAPSAPAAATGSNPSSAAAPVSAARGSASARPTTTQEWVAGARRPVVIRIPRAGILLAALALIVILFAAYWVGWLRRDSQLNRQAQVAVQNQANERTAALQNLGNQPGTPRSTAKPLTGSTNTTAGKVPVNAGASSGTGTATPSQPQNGLYYFVLATTNQPGAEKLVRFLIDNGVDAAAVSRNNGRSFQVLALRGFTRDEVKALAYRDYEKQLHAVGRRWANASRGNKDLSDMYIPADPYQGEPTPAPPANRTKPR
ncbi:MAG: hypothetical protein IT444_03010 [Phycisphaeraceae bacterium]|nr:hypothetical protein [Phycisphaeraceae bacterium]